MKKCLFLGLLLLFVMTCPSYAANEWRKGTGENVILGTENVSDIDKISYENIVDPLDRLLAGYRKGMDITYLNADALSISAGEVVCSNSTGTIRRFRRNTSSTTVYWSDLDTGSERAYTIYYVYAVADTDATTCTFKISASSSAPTGVTYYARLGSFYNDAYRNIVETSVYANQKVDMDSDGRLPYANSIARVLHATDSTITAAYTNMDGGGQWQSFDVVLSNTSTIIVVGGCEISSNSSTIDGYIRVIYGGSQIAEAHAGGEGATYPYYESVGIYGIATNVPPSTYTIRPQLKAGGASINTFGKIYCMVYIIPE